MMENGPQNVSIGLENVADVPSEGMGGSRGRRGGPVQDIGSIEKKRHLDISSPRFRSRLTAVVLAVVFILLAFLIHWFLGRPVKGHLLDHTVSVNLKGATPQWFSSFASASLFAAQGIYITLIVLMAVAAFAIAAVRRRWWLVLQAAIFFVVSLIAIPIAKWLLGSKSFPITLWLLLVACMLLLITVPRPWRALVTLVEGLYVIMTMFSMMLGNAYSLSAMLSVVLVVCALAMAVLALTRTSGMDPLAERMHVMSVQIGSTLMISFGIVCWINVFYLRWQWGRYRVSSQWVASASSLTSYLSIAGLVCIAFGTVVAVRQLTAAPLMHFDQIGERSDDDQNQDEDQQADERGAGAPYAAARR
ncbi:hypothetical protein [Bifidobacterium sp. ESL0745]|uniref:hypothetical protein n=1 Tax=Bifidobacterium sp. ESL0745 TaxID=2983226 RepID=UPI0023F943FF|nr:hypothetical protein [Bifidobacterium sp. ESL0745]MDF7664513.1 hypothetical protein [Bifidobacterium sp. ESL0745]